jgi:hypothetical protein
MVGGEKMSAGAWGGSCERAGKTRSARLNESSPTDYMQCIQRERTHAKQREMRQEKRGEGRKGSANWPDHHGDPVSLPPNASGGRM